MAPTPSGFDWDRGNREKCQKHGMAISEIESVFAGAPRVAPDLAHSGAETRFVAIGTTHGGRAAFVAFTLREKGGRTLIRPVSARFMHRKEVERHEGAKDDDR